MPSLLSESVRVRKAFKISDSEFLNLRNFIYDKCGIFIGDKRKYLLENRLGARLKELNLKSFKEYYDFLSLDANKAQELHKLFEVVTTNETSFFRNPPQLEVFEKQVLVDVMQKSRLRGKKIRIWSAGCSTGEEPYTLSIILHEVLKSQLAQWDVRITSSDLSDKVLQSARKGVYSDYTLRTTPSAIVDKYFQKDGISNTIDKSVKSLVRFGQINLKDKLAIRRLERSQIIFCRNVIIYFDDDMKKQVLNSFYDNLLPGGYLIIGHSESLHTISRAFKPIHYPGSIVYQKEG